MRLINRADRRVRVVAHCQSARHLRFMERRCVRPLRAVRGTRGQAGTVSHLPKPSTASPTGSRRRPPAFLETVKL